MKTNDKNGAVMGSRQVLPKDDLMLVSNKGQMIRIRVGEISEQGRNTQGVRLMTVSPGEKVVGLEYMAESSGTDTPTDGGAVPAPDALNGNGADGSGGTGGGPPGSAGDLH
jgi:DNA gyrase subunit A